MKLIYKPLLSFLGTKSGQRRAGITMLLVALILGLQPLVHAADNPDQIPTYTVQSDVSDQEIFGKSLTSSRPLKAFSSSVETHPATGPIVPAGLRIPALGIDTSVETVGLKNGNMEVPTNIWNVGWLKDSVLPGGVGNAVIAGHKDSVRGAAIFWNLGQLKPGDHIYVSDANGSELVFEVTEVGSYLNSEVPLMQLFGPSDQKRLNLITCDGTFSRQQHNYDRRLIVYTRLVDETP